MIAQILSTMLPVFVIAGCGALYGRYRTPDIQGLNILNMELFVPMLVFAVLADQQAPLQEYAQLALAAAVVVLGSGIILYPVAKVLKLNLKTFLPPMMFNNSGNMGIPYWCLPSVKPPCPRRWCCSSSKCCCTSRSGFICSTRTSIVQRLKLPIVFASIAGLAVNLGGVPLPEWLLETLNMLGGVCIPLMLFALGVRMLDVDFSDWKLGMLGAIACPASGLILAWPMIELLDLPGMQVASLWVFAALPPAVLNYMVAEQYRQEPHKVASLVLLSNLGSLVVIPIVLGLVFAQGYV